MESRRLPSHGGWDFAPRRAGGTNSRTYSTDGSKGNTSEERAITRTARVLVNGLGEQVLLRTQEPIRLNDYSEPEPDVAVVQVNPLDYADHHPTPEEVYLVIEVADRSLSKDRETKARIYAQAGIADYWILRY